MARTVYTIKTNRLKQSYGYGFSMDEDATLYLDEQEVEHRLYLAKVDAAADDADWGRLSFRTRLSEEQILYVYALATNETKIKIGNEDVDINRFLTSDLIPDSSKKVIMTSPLAKRYVGKSDILLYELKGRYLYLAIEVIGEGGGTLSGLRVERGDGEFMEAFPEIYRENNEFFKRYLQVFNSIYNDFDVRIDRLPDLLDLNACPEELLPIYAGWLGIDVQGDFLKPDALRTLVKEAYNLNRIKGTKACLKRILEIAVDEPSLVLEENQMQKYGEEHNHGEDVFDVIVLVKKQLSETERYQLTYLLEQFLPIRCRLKLESFQDSGMLDTRVYLDMNAQVSDVENAKLDDYMGMDGYIVLEE